MFVCYFMVHTMFYDFGTGTKTTSWPVLTEQLFWPVSSTVESLILQDRLPHNNA
jgi:hypothetical protein